MDFPKTSGIYLIKNKANSKCYVGQSQNIYRRIHDHLRKLSQNKHHNHHLQKEWNKYGRDTFEFSVLELCDISLLDEKEIYYIAYHNAFKDGYNYDEGGGTRRGYVASDETRAKMRLNHCDVSGKNNPMYGVSLYDILTDDEIKTWKHKISVAMSGGNNPSYGKKLSDEAKAKISAANKGRFAGKKNRNYGKTQSEIFGADIKEKLSRFRQENIRAKNPHAHSVVLLNTQEVFGCIIDASEKYNTNKISISECCSGTHYSAGIINNERLVWVYYEDYIKMTDEEKAQRIFQAQNRMKGGNHFGAKSVICLTTNEIFSTAAEAAKYYNTDNSSIGKVCKGRLKTCGKHPLSGAKLQWAYYDDYSNNHANQTSYSGVVN